MRLMLLRALEQRTRPGEAGQALVEFALIVSPLMLVLFATFQIVLVAWIDQTVRLAAAEGARLAVFCNDAAVYDRELKVGQRVGEILRAVIGARADSARIEPRLAPPPARGEAVSVTVSYLLELPLPLLARDFREVRLSATAVAVADKEPAAGGGRCVPPE